MHIAAYNGHEDIVKLLLQRMDKKDLNTQNDVRKAYINEFLLYGIKYICIYEEREIGWSTCLLYTSDAADE